MDILTRVDADGLARKNVGHEHNSAIDTTEAFASVYPFVDNDIVYDRSFP